MRIVLAEDNVLLRDGLTRILQAYEIEILHAVDNAPALDVALADPVRQGTREGCADGVGDRERTGGETAEAVAAGGGGDEEERAELAHREREPGEERDDDVRRAGELEEPPVGGEG